MINLSKEHMKRMCDYVEHCSQLNIRSHLEDRKPAESELKRLIDEGLIGDNSHLQQGIRKFSYNLNSVSIEEKPLQYPSGDLIKAVEDGGESSDLLGPMTGVFVHVFDKDKYAVHVRGKGIAAPGKIQIVAGMGEYGVYPADLALREVAEEIYGAETDEQIEDTLYHNDVELALPHDIFLDVTPFMKAGFPQPLFSYIATADLDHLTEIIRNNEELEKFEKILSQNRTSEAYPFIVPIENLRDFTDEIDSIGKSPENPDGKFYGPVKETVESFLGWYNQTYGTSY